VLALLAVLLCFQHPDLLEMPRAEAYLVKDGSRSFLEDRFNRLDLWQSHVTEGCWYDDDGRYYLSAVLRETPPATDVDGVLTREEYAESVGVPEKDNDRQLLAALERLTDETISPDFEKFRRLPRGAKAVRFYRSTNDAELICAFLPEKNPLWRVLIASVLSEDDRGECVESLIADLLEPMLKEIRPETRSRRPAKRVRERELLRADARHSVAAYPEWRVTDSEEFTILDNLETSASFLVQVSNELSVARARFAAAMPSPLDASNTLAVARIFATRAEYAEVCGYDMLWTAAYWNPLRRELVAYLPEGGGAELIRTLRHESFHQYLSYATSMITVSPWFNEGYAQYFEDVAPAKVEIPGEAKANAANVPSLLAMGYDEFYGGTEQERHYKYLLAKSIATFIELGAPKVFKKPFENLKRDYVRALLETKDHRKATSAAFGSPQNLELFVSEWTKYQFTE